MNDSILSDARDLLQVIVKIFIRKIFIVSATKSVVFFSAYKFRSVSYGAGVHPGIDLASILSEIFDASIM